MADPAYSPRLRTGVVLCGTGTAGAYQAGVLRALVDAGVKIDLLAAHGAGVATALCTAIDGGARVWDAATGPWTNPRLRHAYRWRPALRVAAWSLLAALVILGLPLLVMVWAALVYAASLVASMVGAGSAAALLLSHYQRSLEVLFHPPIIPTVVPRALVVTLIFFAAVLLVAAARAVMDDRSRRRRRGAFWWRLVGSPLSVDEPTRALVETMWALVRGASNAPTPTAAEVGRRYVDVLTDNLGQPGFHEVLVVVHDLDARRDLVGAVLAPSARAAFEARRAGAAPREAETVDFTGPQRDLVVDFVRGALRLPVATTPEALQFPPESFWRGELHRICDRPDLPVRLVEELAAIGVEQVVLVSAAPPSTLPHGLRSTPAALRSRMGEVVRALETAAVDDATAMAANRFSGVFVIRPDHNPIGPFDFAGVYDEASDRTRTVAELLQTGYDDAYRQFIEPVVATGERLDTI